MNARVLSQWHSANYRYLLASLEVVRQALETRVALVQNQPTPSPATSIESVPKASAAILPAPSALQQLCTTFGLSDFERDLLLLCAGMELDPNFVILCANAQGDMQLGYPTFSLAMSALPQAHWSAIAPSSPLRRWRLIQVGGGKTLMTSPLRIDERILHYLVGVDYLDDRLRGIIESVSVSEYLVPSHQQIAQKLAGIFSRDRGLGAGERGSGGAGERGSYQLTGETPVLRAEKLAIVQLCGDEVASKRAIAQVACAMSGMKLAAMSALAVPTVTGDLNNLMLLWEREALLNKSALLLDCDEMDGNDPAKENAIAQLIASIDSPLIITSRDRRRALGRPLISFDVPKPTTQEQLAIWENALGDIAPTLNGQVEVLVSQFNLSAPTIYAVCAEVTSQGEDIVGAGFTDVGAGLVDNPSVDRTIIGQNPPLQKQTIEVNSPSLMLENRLWDSCRAQARPRLDELAQRIEPAATWDDLVLPEAQRVVLREIAAHVRQRLKVYQKWGFASKGGRGLGISALFAGSSGTGKTMSAEVLAGVLQLDLYRIDLSMVVSKYIGETEKNLRRVFDAAEGGATILLFDEADSLFGKRSDVKDSHDRYANMEVSYLLQRMEAYQGLAILTTNLKDSIDTAFLRRIRFVVKYPFPDAQQRAEIWQRIFPKNTPTEGLDFNRLARLNVAGGNIRNIALNAAFLAAEAGESVSMKHLLEAAKSEYIKLERTLTDTEVKGWI